MSNPVGSAMSPETAIYLDHAATSPLRPEVAAEMQRLAQQRLANPASQHRAGQRARRVLEQARESILTQLGAQTTGLRADRLIFTSGGTEANHLALLGLAADRPGPVLISAIEHPSLRGAAELLQRQGVMTDTIRVDADGRLDLNDAEAKIKSPARPRLVSVMSVNNETGVVQPIAELARLCAAYEVALHTDAVQAIGKIPFRFAELPLTAVSLTPHKLGGPLGIGALLVHRDARLEPMMRGGFQQAGERPGTESVVLAGGFAAALEFSLRNEVATSILDCRTSFERMILSACEATMNGAAAPRAPHVSNIAFAQVDRQQLLLALDTAGVYCSTGSACASGSSEPSPVLLAMGLSSERILGSLRFSFGADTTISEMESAVRRISLCVNRLRRR